MISGPTLEVSQETEEEQIYQRIFRTSLLLLRNYHDAWDLTQEIFLSLEEGRSKWEKAQSKRAWAAGVFYRQLQRFYRLKKQRRKLVAAENASELVDRTPSPVEQLALAEELEQTWQAFDQLEPSLAEALLLFSVQNLRVREIAQLQGVSEGTVKWRIFEARRRLAVKRHSVERRLS